MQLDAGSEARVVLVDGDIEVVVARLGGRPADLALIDALARLQLAAARDGCSIRVHDAPPGLCGLLGLVGLAGLLDGSPMGCELGVEVERQAEGREQLGVQEVVQPGDPTP